MAKMPTDDTCPLRMTATEILQKHIRLKKPRKTVLIVDTGRGWTVTKFGPEAAGLCSDHITLQSTLQEVEGCLVNLRRQSNDDIVCGEIVTDPDEIAKALAK